MIVLEGETTFAAPQATVQAHLADLSFLVTVLPDVAETKSVTDASAEVVLRPNFSFIRSNLDLSIARRQSTPTGGELELRTKGIGSTSLVVATYELREDCSLTTMKWRAEIRELGGLLKMTPPGLVQGSAQAIVTSFLRRLGERLTGLT